MSIINELNFLLALHRGYLEQKNDMVVRELYEGDGMLWRASDVGRFPLDVKAKDMRPWAKEIELFIGFAVVCDI